MSAVGKNFVSGLEAGRGLLKNRVCTSENFVERRIGSELFPIVVILVAHDPLYARGALTGEQYDHLAAKQFQYSFEATSLIRCSEPVGRSFHKVDGYEIRRCDSQ